MSESIRENMADAAGDAHEHRDKAPSADEIERRLRSWPVLGLRPAVWAGLGVLSLARRFSWSAHFECDLMRLDGPLIFAANRDQIDDPDEIYINQQLRIPHPPAK